MKRTLLSIVIACAVSAARAAHAADAPPADEAELQSLLEVIAQETEVATRNRQNADFVPGIVTVLGANEARALGARNVLDAIALVPGIEVNRDTRGSATLRVRGLDAFFNSGNVKVQVNGLDMSYQVAEQNTAFLLMPLDLVDRIEVIRGPGSSVHGDFAFNGLVNIVTHDRLRAVYAEGGRGGESNVGGSYAAGEEGDGGWRFSGNAARYTSDRYDAPGQIDADEQRNYADIALAHGGFAFKASGIDRDQDRVLPNGAPQDLSEHLGALEGRYDWRFGADNRVGAWGRYSGARYDSDPLVFEGNRTELGADANWRFGAHLLLAEATFTDLEIENQVLPPAPPLPPNIPLPTGRRPARVSTTLQSRAMLLQDQYDVSERLTLTGGLRYDDYADVTDRVTPRLAAVWRVGERDTVKAQYGEGFRTPVTTELYDSGVRNTDLDFEIIRTFELGYIHRTARQVFRVTLFDSTNADTLVPAGPPGAGFRNKGSIDSAGVEVEWSAQLASWLKLTANVSKIETQSHKPIPGNEDPDVDAFGTPDLLANIGLIASPIPELTLGANWNHVGDRFSTTGDIEGYDNLSLSGEYRFARWDGLALRVAVHNATDDEITHALGRPPPLAPFVLDYGGRLWTAEISYRL